MQFKAAVAIILLVLAPLNTATAQSIPIPPRNETPEARATRFESWVLANPNIEARIAKFKSDTAAKIAAWRASQNSTERFADLRIKSKGLSAADKQAAGVEFKNAYFVWKAGDFTAAEIGFRRGLAIDPANGPANFYLGDMLRRNGDNAGAREYFERALRLGAGSPESLRAQAALTQLPQTGDPLIGQPPVIWEVASRPRLIWDAADAPEMVVVPAGTYTMGSTASEPGRSDDEAPQKRVTIARPFSASRFEITRGQYAAFSDSTGRQAGNNCITDRAKKGSWAEDPRGTWRDPAFSQTDDHPVVCSVGMMLKHTCNGSARRPGVLIGCFPKRNGNMQRGPGREQPIGGATARIIRMQITVPIHVVAAWRRELTNGSTPHPPQRFRRILLVFTTLQATSGNGRRIVT